MSNDELKPMNQSYEDLVNAEIIEKRKRVEENTKENLARAEARRKEELQAGIDYQKQAEINQKAAIAHEWEELTVGFNDVQKSLTKEWLAVRSQIARGQLSTKDLQKLTAKSKALEDEITSGGRNLGDFYFKKFTVYLNASVALIMMPNDNGVLELKRGTFNSVSLPSGEKSIEFDENGIPTRLVNWGHWANNIPIVEFHYIVLGGTEPQKIIPHKPLFETLNTRPIKPEEKKKFLRGIKF